MKVDVDVTVLHSLQKLIMTFKVTVLILFVAIGRVEFFQTAAVALLVLQSALTLLDHCNERGRLPL
jgi:hypothetical protein